MGCPRSSFVGRECSAASTAAAVVVVGQQTQKDAETAINFPTPSVSLSPPLWSVGIVTKELCDREIFGKCPEGRLADAATAAQQEDEMISATISKKYKM